jgi:hypothetical protein
VVQVAGRDHLVAAPQFVAIADPATEIRTIRGTEHDLPSVLETESTVRARERFASTGLG